MTKSSSGIKAIYLVIFVIQENKLLKKKIVAKLGDNMQTYIGGLITLETVKTKHKVNRSDSNLAVRLPVLLAMQKAQPVFMVHLQRGCGSQGRLTDA